ncbi:MAG: CHAD domain-containing protein [Chloroflexota bacterium]|nr:CHAD domain-containing protein [Chloroflexota bacterium]
MSELAPASTGDLAILVLQRNGADFLEHAPGARAGSDPFHVHQMRVATRRMRAALRLFADTLPVGATTLNEELKWFASQLGPVRDLDVQLHRVHATAGTLGVAGPLAAYADWLENQQQCARKKLAEAFESRRFGALVQGLQRLDAWPIAESPPVVAEAPRQLRQAYTQLRKRANAVDDQTPAAALHAVRIRAKRLRYTAEFFQPTYGKPARRLAERVVSVQDLLGNLQDGIVSRQHIHAAVQSSADGWPAQTTLALGRLVQFEADREMELRAGFPDAYRGVQKAWRRLPKLAAARKQG